MGAGLINYREDRCMSGESTFKTEISLMNYRHDRCISGESKILNIETGLMSYRHARCMSVGRKVLTEAGFANY